jgi:hypothetical protein
MWWCVATACPQDPAVAQALLLKQAMKAHLSHARKVLSSAAVSEPSQAGAAPNLTQPVLTVQVMQRNTSRAIAAAGGVSLEALPLLVIAPAAYGYTPVSGDFQCNLKEGNAVKCNIAITKSSLTAAYKPGVENYLAFSLNTPGQVRDPCRALYWPAPGYICCLSARCTFWVWL